MDTPLNRSRRLLPWVLVALIVGFAALVRIRLLDVPLERDEGEYAYAGQLLLQGIPPYKLAFNMKFPGTYGAYAAIMAVFGQTAAGVHRGFLVVNAATIVLIFLVGRRMLTPLAGVAAGAAYALLSIGAGVMGTQAHATHFVVLAAMGGTLLLLRATNSARAAPLFFSGVLYGVAVLMKQHAVFLAAFGASYLLWDHLTRHRPSILRNLALFLSGVCAPVVLTGLALWRAGVFDKFWLWTVVYAREYVQAGSFASGLRTFGFTFAKVVGPNLAIWLAALAGLVLIWWKKEDRARAVFVTGLLGFSFLAMVPGFYFREHYFVLLLPAIALLAGAAVSMAREKWPDATLPIYGAALAVSAAMQLGFLVQMSPMEVSRAMYGDNPFPEAMLIGDYIRAHSASGSEIAVLGSEPEIPFYADRRSATGYIYMYGLMEPRPSALTMQEGLIRDVEASHPDYVVVVRTQSSWLRWPNSSPRVFDWWKAYGPLHYKVVGLATVDPALPIEVQWREVAPERIPPQASLVVYKRTDP
jgi:hypothetical protein